MLPSAFYSMSAKTISTVTAPSSITPPSRSASITARSPLKTAPASGDPEAILFVEFAEEDQKLAWWGAGDAMQTREWAFDFRVGGRDVAEGKFHAATSDARINSAPNKLTVR